MTHYSINTSVICKTLVVWVYLQPCGKKADLGVHKVSHSIQDVALQLHVQYKRHLRFCGPLFTCKATVPAG